MKFRGKIIFLCVIIMYCFYLFCSSLTWQYEPVVTVQEILESLVTPNDLNLEYELPDDSLCSIEATKNGPHQKVISYSLFHDPKNTSLPPKSLYVNGIQSNIKKAKQYYPGWVIRIYAQSQPNFTEYLRDIATANPGVFICDIENIPNIGNVSMKLDALIWRFLPLMDPTVDVFISRDLDSAIGLRESSAVTEWLESNKTFHVMRDNPYHDMPILGGTWGAKTSKINGSMKHIFKMLAIQYGNFNDRYFLRNYDQQFLTEFVYPFTLNDLMAHDSYFCKWYPGSVPFPVQRSNNTDFVGNLADTPIEITVECPSKCRPSFGKDWKFC